MSNLQPRSLYDVLGVSPEAEPVVIEAAYRALMKRHHPDHAGEAAVPRDAAGINAAYSVLRDPGRRAEYDRQEWQRRQALIRAQQLPGLPARRLRAASFGGWLVAGALGAGAGFSLAGSSSIAIPPAPSARIATAEGAADVAADPAPPHAVGEGLFQSRSGSGPAPVAAETAVPVVAGPRETPEEMVVARSLPEPRRRPGASAEPERRRPARAEEQDFLEREGFIY